MHQGYSHIKHTVLYPYDKNILPISFDEVNAYAYNIYEGKIIPDNYNPLINPQLPDTFDEKAIKNNTKIARDLFERHANVPLLFQKEQQSALIQNTDIELPLRYSYIQTVDQVLVKTTEIDEKTGDNIWYKIPKKDYCIFIYSSQNYINNKVTIKYSKEQPKIDTNCYENLKIVFIIYLVEILSFNLIDVVERAQSKSYRYFCFFFQSLFQYTKECCCFDLAT